MPGDPVHTHPRVVSIAVDGYRSLTGIEVELAGLTLIRGGNGTGKTNLYRALGLAVSAADGTLSRHIAGQGGMASAMWAGRAKKGPRRIRLTVTWEDLRYTIQLGLPQTVGNDPFPLDPEVKKEAIEFRGEDLRGRPGRWLVMGERANATAFLRNDDGERVTFPFELWRGESMLSQVRDPRTFALAAEIQARLLSWRLYHQFRTDPESPIRTVQPGVRTPALAADGSDLGAAVATIWHIGRWQDFQRHVDAAFPGGSVGFVVGDGGGFDIEMQLPGLMRPLRSGELSDGTLRYLCLLTALLSPRPPTLMAFNEPETSLHPDLLGPLGELLVEGSRTTQVWVTTHALALADHVAAVGPEAAAHQLYLVGGETFLRRE